MVDPVRSLSSASYRKSGSMSNGWNCQYWWNPLKATVDTRESRKLLAQATSMEVGWVVQRLGTKQKGCSSSEGKIEIGTRRYRKLNKNRLGLGFEDFLPPFTLASREVYHQNVNVYKSWWTPATCKVMTTSRKWSRPKFLVSSSTVLPNVFILAHKKA